MERHQLTQLTLLDFSNAFNSVDSDILIATLKSLNFSPSCTDWFRSYLEGRFQCVRLRDGAVSGWMELRAGVPQGGILSPLLFSIFIGPITRNISCNYHLYADDLQIYTHFRMENISDAVHNTSQCLQQISDWATSHGLILNPSKSQTMFVGIHYYITKLKPLNIPVTIMNSICIPYSTVVRDLGLMVDQRLSWQQHVNGVRRRFFCTFHSLKRFQKFLPTKVRIVLVQALLLSHIDYADAAYVDLDQDLLDKLERLQNIGIRYIFNLKKYDHITEHRNGLRWLTMRQRRELHILTLVHKALYAPSSPNYIKEMFEYLASHGLPLRSNDERLLTIPQHTTNFLAHSFMVHGARL